MGILADLVDHVVGIDPDRDWITAAVVDAKTTAVMATERFTADRDGYGELLDWARGDHHRGRAGLGGGGDGQLRPCGPGPRPSTSSRRSS